MIWVLAFLAAIAGAFIASESRSFFGFVASFALVGLFGLVLRQSRRIDELNAMVRRLEYGTRQGTAPHPAELAESRAAEEEWTDPAVSAVPESEPAPDAPRPAAAPPPIPEAVDTPSRARREAPSPRHAPEAVEPNGFERAFGRLKAFLFEGNLPVKLGLIVSLFGVGALIRYAASEGWLTVPVAYRYAGIALAGIAMLVYGLRQAPLRPAFGLSLQGGAIGILLLTVFGSYRLPGLLPAGLAFALVLGLVAGAAVLAIRQNAVWLAAIGLLGGYLAPILLSTGSGNHVALFSYYALLNAAVFGMAWVRPWRALNLLGFVFTFGVGALWGAKYFKPELFATTEPFLVAFFLMYVTIPVLYALRGRVPGKVDATLLFGTPLIAFPMQVALVDGERLPLAFSALAVGAVYLLLALWSRREEKLRVLGQSAAALGLAFATLAVPLALSARWTSAAWALQGVALLWLGQTQQRRWPQFGGVALQALAGIAYLVALGSTESNSGEHFILNGHAMNLLLLTASAGACAWLFDRQHDDRRSWGGALLSAVATSWWFWLGLREISINLKSGSLEFAPAWLGFIALTCVVGGLLLRRIDWRKPAWWPTLALPTAVFAVAGAFFDNDAWLWQAQGLCLLALAVAMAIVLPAMRPMIRRLGVAHISGLAAISLALGLGIHQALDAMNLERLGSGWAWILPWVPLALLAGLLVRRPMIAGWPVGEEVLRYRPWALGLAVTALGGVWLVTQVVAGSAAPLPWVPLLNPVELFQLAGLAALAIAHRQTAAGSTRRLLSTTGLGLASFLMLSMVTLRACWQWEVAGPNPYTWGDSVDWMSVASWPQAQAALSVVWSLAGVLCWVIGSRRHSRPLWTFGALLLGAVLLKLLAIDRQNLGDLLGIVSFLTVGGLLVVVGRIAPRPPSAPPESE